MRKIVVIAALVAAGILQAQEERPKVSVEGNQIKATYFYDNGQIQQEGYFLNGKPHGTWASYNEQGQKTAIGTYENGVKTGNWMYFSNDVLKQVTYTENKPSDIRLWTQESLAKN